MTNEQIDYNEKLERFLRLEERARMFVLLSQEQTLFELDGAPSRVDGASPGYSTALENLIWAAFEVDEALSPTSEAEG